MKITDFDYLAVQIAAQIFVATLPSCRGDPEKIIRARWDAVHHARMIVSEVRSERAVYKKNLDVELEHDKILATLAQHDGVVMRAARELGVTTQTIYNRMEKYKLRVGG